MSNKSERPTFARRPDLDDNEKKYLRVVGLGCMNASEQVSFLFISIWELRCSRYHLVLGSPKLKNLGYLNQFVRTGAPHMPHTHHRPTSHQPPSRAKELPTSTVGSRHAPSAREYQGLLKLDE